MLYADGTAEPDCASTPPTGTTRITLPAGLYPLTAGAPALGQRHLSVGTTVDLDITAANTVGEVVRFTVLAGKLPKESFLCMPPGTHTPAACTS